MTYVPLQISCRVPLSEESELHFKKEIKYVFFLLNCLDNEPVCRLFGTSPFCKGACPLPTFSYWQHPYGWQHSDYIRDSCWTGGKAYCCKQGQLN